MKIIISPSKTRDFTVSKVGTQPQFTDKSLELFSKIKGLSKDELANIMKIKGKLLDTVFDYYSNFEHSDSYKAIESYTGMVFKGIDFLNLDDKSRNFINDHLIILSAFYGVLRPTDLIKPYRLDMTMKIMDESLYSYWGNIIDEYLNGDDLIINLASSEFSKLIKRNVVTVTFKEYVNDKYVIKGTYSKMARGKMINIIANNNINSLCELRLVSFDGYKYNNELSTQNEYIFTRNTIWLCFFSSYKKTMTLILTLRRSFDNFWLCHTGGKEGLLYWYQRYYYKNCPKLISQISIKETNMTNIAGKAVNNRCTLYWCFKTKADLVLEITYYIFIWFILFRSNVSFYYVKYDVVSTNLFERTLDYTALNTVFFGTGLLPVLQTVLLIDYGEWKNGRCSEGAVFSSQAFVVKLTIGIAIGTIGDWLSLFGYNNSLEIHATGAVTGIRMMMFILPVFIISLTLWLFRKF